VGNTTTQNDHTVHWATATSPETINPMDQKLTMH